MKDRKDHEQEAANELKKQRLRNVTCKIPLDFLTPIDRARPTVDWKAFDEIQEWDGRKSITARGVSQIGKTRAIYQVLKREYVENYRSFLVLDEFQLLAKVSDAAKNGKLEELARKFNDSDILFIDDIDKVNFSQGVTGNNALTLIFGVIKRRMATQKPTILSYNLSLTEVFAHAGEHTMDSLIRRVKQEEYWLNIEFRQRSNLREQ